MLVVALTVACLAATEVGDTHESVAADKGPPIGQVKGAGAESLRDKEETTRGRKDGVARVEETATSGPIATNSAPVNPELDPQKPTTSPPPLFVPPFPRCFVGTPEFHTTEGSQSAGTAFLARRPGSPQVYVLTVHHFLGADGRVRELIPHAQVPSFVRAIRIDELFGHSTWYAVAGCAFPPGSDPKGPQAELAAFKTKGIAAEAAPLLAKVVPPVSASVWVIAEVEGGVPKGVFIHRARVVENEGPWLIAEFENSQIETTGASGAPVLNADGEIVGIYAGHADEDGHKYAYLLPSPLIIEILQAL